MVDLALLQSVSYIAGALGVCVAAFYYVMTLRVQQANMKSTLETRQAQLLMAVYDKLTEPLCIDMWTKIVKSDYSDFPDFKRKYLEDPDMLNALYIMAMRFEGFGLLVRENLLDIRHVALLFGGVTRKYFEKIQPVLGEIREEQDYTRFMDQTEYLYTQLMAYLKLHPELNT
jgi:hypothetical protein